MATMSGSWREVWHRGNLEIVVVLIGLTAVLLAVPLNSDSAYNMMVARRLFEGDQLYVNVMDFNPPLIFWLMTIPAAVGRAFDWSDARVVSLFVSAVMWTSGGLAVAVLAPTQDAGRLLRSSVVASLLAALVLLLVYQVGQREQLAAMLSLPYALLAARAASGQTSTPRLAIVCGLLAGVGMAIKPFFAAPMLAMEAVVVALQGPRGVMRPEVVAAVLVQCLYVAAVWVVDSAYFTRMVPLAMEWYGAYDADRVTMVTEVRVLVLAAIGIGALAVPHWLPRGFAGVCARVFGAATIGWLASYIAQGKGWSYHLLPAEAFALAALAALGVAIQRIPTGARFERRVRRFGATVALGAVAASPVLASLAYRAAADVQRPQEVRRDWFAEMLAIIERHAGGEPVYVMSTSAWPAFPLANMARLRWPYPYQLLWPIPALYSGAVDGSYRSPEQHGELEAEFFNSVVAGLVRVPPKLLIVERGAGLQGMPGRTFDFVAYFSGAPEFAALFQRYHRLTLIEKWEIYERRDEVAERRPISIPTTSSARRPRADHRGHPDEPR